MTIGILVLAAGRSLRFGADKRLVTLPDSQRVIDATLANVRASQLPLLVCVGAGDVEVIRSLEEQGISYKCCSRAGEGMGGTLAEGACFISGWRGVLVALADMPWIAPTTYLAVAERLSAGSIVVPVCDGQRGHPVGFGCEFYADLSALGGDTGARQLLAMHAGSVTELAVTDPAIYRDIDVPADMFLPN